jgi:hypothetical protein
VSRPLHPETKPQRAARKSAPPKARRAQGYEDRDAPPAKVALGAMAFYAVMVLGLAGAAMTISLVAPRMGLVAHAPAKPRFAHASLPPLLVDQAGHRRRLEAEARRHLDPQRIQQAMAELEAKQAGEAR